jgi:TRAP-type C4-dicarboxylate transport system permease small subunit
LSRFQSILAVLDKAGRFAEDTVLVIILTSMILLAASQIILRNFFDFGFIWADELLRMLVLWIAVAGAVAASRTDKHINVAVLDRFLSGRVRVALKLVVDLFTAVICAVITWHSIAFVQTSHEYRDVLLGSVPAWILQLVLPVGFGLISWRYFVFSLRQLPTLFRPGDPA